MYMYKSNVQFRWCLFGLPSQFILCRYPLLQTANVFRNPQHLWKSHSHKTHKGEALHVSWHQGNDLNHEESLINKFKVGIAISEIHSVYMYLVALKALSRQLHLYVSASLLSMVSAHLHLYPMLVKLVQPGYKESVLNSHLSSFIYATLYTCLSSLHRKGNSEEYAHTILTGIPPVVKKKKKKNHSIVVLWWQWNNDIDCSIASS